jgi:RNA polymerase primary sigma factor
MLAERMEITEDKIRKIMKIAKEPISMETPIGDDDDSVTWVTSSKTVPTPHHWKPPCKPVCVMSPKDILDMPSHPREAKVLRMRFGIEMTNDHTFEEVGKQFDVTRERMCAKLKPRHCAN